MDSMERNDDIAGSGSGDSNVVTLASRASSNNVRVLENIDDELEDAYYETPVTKNVGRIGSLYPPRKFSKTSLSSLDYLDENGNDDWVKMPSSGGYKYDSESEERGGTGDDCDALGQIVSSIKEADGFMKMGKMKMDMAHEIEKMRMEAEMKRNEMLLESQRQLVDAFVKGLAEDNK